MQCSLGGCKSHSCDVWAIMANSIFGGKRGECKKKKIPSTLLKPVKFCLERKTADKTLTVMDWHPQSPDLNIIKAVWDHLDRERNRGQPKSKEELWELLKEA